MLSIAWRFRALILFQCTLGVTSKGLCQGEESRDSVV